MTCTCKKERDEVRLFKKKETRVSVRQSKTNYRSSIASTVKGRSIERTNLFQVPFRRTSSALNSLASLLSLYYGRAGKSANSRTTDATVSLSVGPW